MGISKLKSEVARLSVEERAALAYWIITNLDVDNEDQVDSAWRKEIRSRVEAIQAGKVDMIPASEMWADVLSVYETPS